jgi:bis(5'-nucleosyl)-tetraphosphatase (symmetrical)
MAVYAVGDIQGCYDELRLLLDKLQFDPDQDQLWSCGDLVNRGPKSLKTLRFCHSLGDSFVGVLGNHDLHMLSVSRGHRPPRRGDTFRKFLTAPDRDELLDWLRRMPLFHYDSDLGIAMVHAGVHPAWNLKKCRQLSSEISRLLLSNLADQYLASMYGNRPNQWKDDLEGPARWRVITNYFTRMRFCTAEGKLELITKAGPNTAPKGYRPWYEHPGKVMKKTPIIFGHWAALMGQTGNPMAQALDTGCAWGCQLTACEITEGFPRTSVDKIK